MTTSAPTSANAEGRIGQPVSDEAVRRLASAVAHLANDSDYFLRALTDMLEAMTPVAQNRHIEAEVKFFIESDAFTPEEWAKTSASVDRGSLQLGTTETWLLSLFATKSMDEVTGFLDKSEEEVQSAVDEGHLYAIEISGRLRFPTWQFQAGSPERLLPGLTDIIAAVTPRWDWRSVAGFMATSQPSLVAEGRKTPAEWLRDGGDVDTVRTIVEASDWR